MLDDQPAQASRASCPAAAIISAVTTPIGPQGLGEFAAKQIANVRIDPRTQRNRDDLGAVVLDFWDEIEEAERLREVGTCGLYELSLSLEREEAKLGVHRDDSNLTEDQRQELQAAWERAEIAHAERANQHPHLNAVALIAMTSALDAFIEDLHQVAKRVWLHIDVEQRTPIKRGESAEDRAGRVAEIAESLRREAPRPPRLE
jgi:hypothetical protein